MAKTPNMYERQEQRFWEEYNRAPLIQDLYPSLATLLIDMTFKNTDWGGDPNPKQGRYKTDSKAFFKIRCPHHECVSGGFDLSSAVAQLIQHSGAEDVGEMTCHGWQDQERINKHRCLLKMKYRISAVYAKHT